jgi:hypothetical protein
VNNNTNELSSRAVLSISQIASHAPLLLNMLCTDHQNHGYDKSVEHLSWPTKTTCTAAKLMDFSDLLSSLSRVRVYVRGVDGKYLITFRISKPNQTD